MDERIISAEFIQSWAGRGPLPVTGDPQVVFAGRSNVGKSSLINALCNRRNLVKTSKIPGKTRLINFFKVSSRVKTFHLVDIPGYGYSRAGKDFHRQWEKMLSRYFQSGEGLCLIVMIIDIRHGLTPTDREFLDWSDGIGVPLLVAANKADKLSNNKINSITANIRKECGLDVLPVSSRSGRNVPLLLETVLSFV